MHSKIYYKLFFIFVIASISMQIYAGGESLVTDECKKMMKAISTETAVEEIKKSQQVSWLQGIMSFKVIVGVGGIGLAVYLWNKYPYGTAYDFEQMDQRKKEKLEETVDVIGNDLQSQCVAQQAQNIEVITKTTHLCGLIKAAAEYYTINSREIETSLDMVSDDIEQNFNDIITTFQRNDGELNKASVYRNQALNKAFASVNDLVAMNNEYYKSFLQVLKETSSEVDKETSNLIVRIQEVQQRSAEKLITLEKTFKSLEENHGAVNIKTKSTSTPTNKIRSKKRVINQTKSEQQSKTFDPWKRKSSGNFSIGPSKSLTDK